MRHQIGEFFHPDIVGASGGNQALAVFIPNQLTSSKDGYGYLAGNQQSMTFRVNTASSGYGFNSIILDAPSFTNNPTPFVNLGSGSKRNAVLLGELISGGDENTYADQFEFSIVRMPSNYATGSDLKVYFKAWGGNLKNYTTNDSAILCGCVSTTS